MEKVTRNPKVIRAAQTDPLMHHRASARWGAEALRTIQWVNRHPGDIYLPVLILHGEADQLNAVEGARQFYEKVTYHDKLLITYPGGYHELHNDLIQAQVLVDMVKWIQRHIQTSAAQVETEVEGQPTPAF